MTSKLRPSYACSSRRLKTEYTARQVILCFSHNRGSTIEADGRHLWGNGDPVSPFSRCFGKSAGNGRQKRLHQVHRRALGVGFRRQDPGQGHRRAPFFFPVSDRRASSDGQPGRQSRKPVERAKPPPGAFSGAGRPVSCGHTDRYPIRNPRPCTVRTCLFLRDARRRDCFPFPSGPSFQGKSNRRTGQGRQGAYDSIRYRSGKMAFTVSCRSPRQTARHPRFRRPLHKQPWNPSFA